MYVHIRFPTNVSGLGPVVAGQILALTGAEALSLIKAGNAVPDPYLDELKERARQLGQHADWDTEPRPKHPRPRATFFASAEDESFGTKLKRAVERRPKSAKQAGERAEKERSRYKPPPRRKPTKGE